MIHRKLQRAEQKLLGVEVERAVLTVGVRVKMTVRQVVLERKQQVAFIVIGLEGCCVCRATAACRVWFATTRSRSRLPGRSRIESSPSWRKDPTTSPRGREAESAESGTTQRERRL